MIKFLSFLFVCLASYSALAQTTKEFFNGNWQRVNDSSKAEYYRIVTYDANGKPQGKVRDYYISGQIQWEGQFSYIDKFDNTRDIQEGLCTWYHKNGEKSSQAFYNRGKINGVYKNWYENGTLASEEYLHNGLQEGMRMEWYENGSLRSFARYHKNELVGGERYECDEFGECAKIFIQDFRQGFVDPASKKSKSKKAVAYDLEMLFQDLDSQQDGKFELLDWPIIDDASGKTEFTKKGLQVKAGKKPLFVTMPYYIDSAADYFIELEIDIRNSDENAYSGLVYSYANDSNYCYVKINGKGNFSIGKVEEGKDTEWFKSIFPADLLSEFNGKHSLGISRRRDTLEIYDSFQGLYLSSNVPFIGQQIGIYADAGAIPIARKLIVVGLTEAPFVSTFADAKTARKGLWKGSGSGFFLSTDGYLATNHHVIENAKEIEITYYMDGIEHSYTAEVVISDKINDLAILKVKDPDFKALNPIPYTVKTPLADVGTKVFALGYPLAMTALGTEVKYTDGVISSRTGREGMVTTYQVSVPVQPGNSGGPLFDYDGNLLGVINEKIFMADNVAFAIKANYITNLVDLLPVKINLPQGTALKNMEPTEQLKVLSGYIPLVKVR